MPISDRCNAETCCVRQNCANTFADGEFTAAQAAILPTVGVCNEGFQLGATASLLAVFASTATVRRAVQQLAALPLAPGAIGCLRSVIDRMCCSKSADVTANS